MAFRLREPNKKLNSSWYLNLEFLAIRSHFSFALALAMYHNIFMKIGFGLVADALTFYNSHLLQSEPRRLSRYSHNFLVCVWVLVYSSDTLISCAILLCSSLLRFWQYIHLDWWNISECMPFPRYFSRTRLREMRRWKHTWFDVLIDWFIIKITISMHIKCISIRSFQNRHESFIYCFYLLPFNFYGSFGVEKNLFYFRYRPRLYCFRGCNENSPEFSPLSTNGFEVTRLIDSCSVASESH